MNVNAIPHRSLLSSTERMRGAPAEIHTPEFFRPDYADAGGVNRANAETKTQNQLIAFELQRASPENVRQNFGRHKFPAARAVTPSLELNLIRSLFLMTN